MMPPNPITKRAKRTSWDISPQGILAYGMKTNLIMRDLNNSKASTIFNTQLTENITAVKYTPNGELAFGTAKGSFKIIAWKDAKGIYEPTYERAGFLAGEILDIAFTEDGSKVIAVGAGGSRAVAIDL